MLSLFIIHKIIKIINNKKGDTMKIKPLWLENMTANNSKKLKESKNVDVLIIGGGITGISTAYHLRNNKLKVCLVEQNLVGQGVTARTTGKLTYLQENIYTKLKDKGMMYYKSQKDAIKLVENIIKKNNIECDYKIVDSYIYTDQDNEINKVKQEQTYLKQLNINYKEHTKLPFDVDCKYAISVSDTAIFHPLKYLNQLKKIIISSGVDVYENSRVTSIEKSYNKYVCIVNDKEVIANKVIIASHYPFFLYPYFIPLKTYIEKSYICACSVDKIKDFSAITISKSVVSLRSEKDKGKEYVIYLNGTHNLCTKCNNKDNFNNLLNDLEKLNLKPDFIWSNQDIMTEDSLPYIGYIDDNLLIGTGYNTWGMTNGSIAGKILSDLILTGHSEYKELFDPKRSKNFNALKYPLNMAYNIKSFVGNKIIKNKSWYNDNIKFTKINDKNVAIYIDENKKEHIVYNICPHLKCSLIFNEVEKTWDCPCHGSRFDMDGKCIFGPSNRDITFKE